VGAVVATGAPAGTAVGATVTARLHPPGGRPFFEASTSTPAGPAAGTADPLAAAATIGAPASIVVGTITGALVGTAAGVASPLATVVIAGAPIGTAAGAPT
jgi:hypothetical protein